MLGLPSSYQAGLGVFLLYVIMELMKQAVIEEIRDKIMPILKTYGVRRVGIFGSAAIGEMGV